METPASGGTWSHGRYQHQQHRARQPTSVPTRTEAARHAHGPRIVRPGRGAPGHGDPHRPPARHRPGIAPTLGRPGRDRPGAATRHHQRGGPRYQRAGTGEPGAATSQRDPEVGLGFLRGGARPPTATMNQYIDAQRSTFWVQPICQTLAIAPSTYYAARSRPPSARARRDAEPRPSVSRVHEENFAVYGARKVWRQLRRDEVDIGRDRVARLMGELGLAGLTTTKQIRTTNPAPES